MANRIASAALQYSKWLRRFICWIWAIYRFAILVASVIEPSSSEALASTVPGIDTIMLVNEGTYLINSLGEKWIYSDRFVLSWIKKDGISSLFPKVHKAVNKEETEEEVDNG